MEPVIFTALIPETGKALTEAFSMLSGFAPDECSDAPDSTSPSVVYPSACAYVEPIFLANGLSNCWSPVAKSSAMLLFTVLAGKDTADK